MKKKEYEIVIKVDTNDADYITEISKISEEDINKIRPLIKAIKNFKPYSSKLNDGSSWKHSHNYPFGECLREDLGEKEPREIYDFDEEIFDIFEGCLPYPEYGFHTIKSITVCPLVKKEKLL